VSSQRPITYSELLDGYSRRSQGGDFEFRSNTVFRIRKDKTLAVFDLVLYERVIATLYPDDIVITAPEGVQRTNTTKNRLNDVLIPLGWRVRQIGGTWKLFPEGHDASVRDYFDGMVVAPQN
jgi:hypothetical protein